MKKVLGVIPARLRSTRLLEKLLLPIDGKPLLYYTWRQARQASQLDRILIATDSREIYRAVKAFGAEPVMTSSACLTGSDRVAEAARAFNGFIPDIVVNIQGDEPLMPPRAIDACVASLLANPDVSMATVASPLSFEESRKDSIVKVVCDTRGRALYFSRSRIPHPRVPYSAYLRHIGLYAFRLPFLFDYIRLPQTSLEIAESLEQLRVLEHGHAIQVAAGDFPNIGVDTLSDFRRVKKMIMIGNRA